MEVLMKKTLRKCAIILCASLAIIACYNEIEPEPPSARGGLLPIAGAFNVRDLGGYTGAGGQTIKYGRLIRSGDLNMLTDRDMDQLYRQIGIRTIVDFRNTEPEEDGKTERSKAPDQKPRDGSVITWDEDGGRASTAIPETIVVPDYDALIRDTTTYPNIASVIVKTADGYKALINNETARGAYKSFFEALRERGNEPLLYHCSAGKDRAGVATALLFLALGVSRQDIINNYMLSVEFVEEKYFPVVPYIINRTYRETYNNMIAQRDDPANKMQYEMGMQNLKNGVIAGVRQGMIQNGQNADIINNMSEEQLNQALRASGQLTIDEMVLQRLQTDSNLSGLLQLAGLLAMTDNDIEAFAREFAEGAGAKVAPLLSVHRDWIVAALDQVQSFGGINRYLTTSLDSGGLGLPADTIQMLQSLYLY